MNKDEALAFDLALEALEYIYEGANNQGPHTGISWRCVAVKAEPAIKAIKQARSAPVQEPVAWYDSESGVTDFHSFKPVRKPNSPTAEWLPLYTTPPAQPAPVQPMAHIVGEIDHAGKVWKPAQRQWVGLTIEEISDEFYKFEAAGAWYQFARAIEAKLKERNNA